MSIMLAAQEIGDAIRELAKAQVRIAVAMEVANQVRAAAAITQFPPGIHVDTFKPTFIGGPKDSSGRPA